MVDPRRAEGRWDVIALLSQVAECFRAMNITLVDDTKTERTETMASKIKLGDIARDTITGFEGIVVAHTRYLSNIDRWSINPRKVKDGKPVESRSFDASQVSYVGESGLTPIPIEHPAEAVELGDTVRHIMNGLEGTVVTITGWFEGCSIIGVQPKGLTEAGVPFDVMHFDERLLAVVSRKVPKLEPVRTGGPREEPRRSY
jgi:heat shock protein HspQ